MISHVVLAHGYFAYVNKISFAYPEHLVHGGVACQGCYRQKNWRNLNGHAFQDKDWLFFASLLLFQVCKQLGTKGQFQFQYEIMIYWHFFNTFMIMMINADTGCLSYKSLSGLPLVITRRLIGGGLQISILGNGAKLQCKGHTVG